MQNIKIKFYPLFVFALCIASLICSSCNPLTYLNEEQSLLVDNKIQIKDRETNESRSQLKAELALLYLQEPNTDFLFIDREWYYFKVESVPDSAKNRVLNNFIRKNIAQAPSIHSEDVCDETAESMKSYLRNKKGYYHAQVRSTSKIKDQEAKVKYLVYTGKQFTINEIKYICEDPELEKIIDEIKLKTLLPPDSPVEEVKFNEEKNRIVRIIQDRGYPSFNSNHVQFSGDTTDMTNQMDVHFNILAPGPNQSHQKYTIGHINVYTDHSIGRDTTIVKHEQIALIDYYSQKPTFEVNPNTLNKRIFIKEGETYVRSRELRTSQALSNLNAYRFVSLNPTRDEQIDTVINYNFLLSPIQNKKVFEGAADVYLANVRRGTAADEQFVGLGLNGDLNYSTRNIANNAEDRSYGANSFIEFNPFAPTGSRINTWGFTGEVRNSIPQLSDYMKVLWLANRLRVVPDKRYFSLNDNTTTDISLTASYTFTATIYRLLSGNLTYGYDYHPGGNSRIRYNQAGINYLQLDPLEIFEEILVENPYLENSFRERFLTGIVFKDLGYSYTSPTNFAGFNWGLTYFLETSGLEVSAINSLYNLASGNSNVWEIPITEDGVEIAKFIKLDLDQRFSQKLFRKHSFAGKFRIGYAFPYGGSETVPYVRQFAVGGQNSIRGWQIRDLGPGGYNINDDPNVTNTNTLPFQTGDFILESSVEYRFPVVGFLNSAFFIDAGNVWSTSPTDLRPDAQLSSDFYKQIAVAAGIGFRLDFSYFLLRFDLGYKIRNPYQNDAGSYFNYQTFTWSNLQDANLSFGVNLPF